MALSAPRNTPEVGYGAIAQVIRLPVKDGVKIYAGSIVVIDAGYAKPGVTATGLLAVGMAEETVDNRSTVTGHADGFVSVNVRQGTFRWALESGDELVAADLGKLAYITDDSTVAKTSSGKSIAGRVTGITSTYAEVRTFIGVA